MTKRMGCMVLFSAFASACTLDLAHRTQAVGDEGCAPAPIEGEDTDEDALTARIIVTADAPVTITGDVNATGADFTCGIGVYVAPGARATIRDAVIHSALAFGIYNDGGQITIVESRVLDVVGSGESCGEDEDETDDGCGGGGDMGGGGDDRGYTGGRHGTGILIVGDGARATITGTTIENFGRRGISVSGHGAFAQIVNNRIIAPATPASWLNGLWIANGANAVISRNTVSGVISPPPVGKSSAAVMIAGGPSHNGMPEFTIGIQITRNTLIDNDTGVLLSNPGLDGTAKTAPSVVTGNDVAGNSIVTSNPLGANDAAVNDGGGNADRIVGNRITGYGARAIVLSPFSVETVVAGNVISE